MRSFFDVEFIQQRGKLPILASIAIVRDDGCELYLVSSDFCPYSTAGNGNWYFKAKVWKHMREEPRVPKAEIARAVRDFLADTTMLACREGGKDRLVLEDLIGEWTRDYCDIEKMWHGLGRPQLPVRGRLMHNALEDARWHKTMYYSVLQPELVAA